MGEPKLPEWDLTDFYDSISDKKISADIETVDKQTADFEKNIKVVLQINW